MKHVQYFTKITLSYIIEFNIDKYATVFIDIKFWYCTGMRYCTFCTVTRYTRPILFHRLLITVKYYLKLHAENAIFSEHNTYLYLCFLFSFQQFFSKP